MNEKWREWRAKRKNKNILRQTTWAVDLFDGKLLIIIFYSLYEWRCRFATTNASSDATYIAKLPKDAAGNTHSLRISLVAQSIAQKPSKHA